MAINVDEIIREGIAAYKAGRKEDARSLLLRAVEIDQYSEQAWLWLSAVVDTPADQRTCLENVLAINPANERARQGLSVLGAPGTAPAPPAPADNGFPTSVEWAAEEEAAFTLDEPAPPAPELPDEAYDDWVANLNLPPTSDEPSDSLFAASEGFDDTLFGSDDVDFDDEPVTEAFSNSPFSTLDFETVFGTPEAATEMPPPPPDPAFMPDSPAVTSAGRAPVVEDDPFADIDLTANGVFSAFETDDVFADDLDSVGTEELFRYIPPDIKPTRLPGTRERYPMLLLLGLVVLVAFNLGALALLVYRLL